MSCRFRRSIDGPAGICLRGKHNQCHTAIALGAQKEAKKGAVFVLHFLTVHSKTAPKRGPYFGPCFGTEAGMGVKKFGGGPFQSLGCIVASGRISLAGKRPKVSPQCSRNRCTHFFIAARRSEALMKVTHLRHTDLPLFRFLVVYWTWTSAIKNAWVYGVLETMREAPCTTREGRGKNLRFGRMVVEVRQL